MSALTGGAAVVAMLLGGAYVVALVDGARLDRASLRARTLAAPLHRLAAVLARRPTTTERQDRILVVVAPALYVALAAIGLAVVPLGESGAAARVDAGIVLWGAVEALTVVAVFLHGWAPNSALPLIGGYRYVAIGLSAMLLSMFVLIGAALPAESLDVARIVESQRGVWNVVRQPLGLPLFVVLGLALTLRGPLDYADSDDLAGGTSAEAAGAYHAAWQIARAAMLVAFSAMAAAVFLGGHLGPVLPGFVWLALKTLAVLVATVALGRAFARPDPSRMLALLWTVLLPLAFVDLLAAGLVALA